MIKFIFMIVFVVSMIALDLYSDDTHPSPMNGVVNDYVILFECKIGDKNIEVYSKQHNYEFYYDTETDKEIIITDFINLTDVKCKYK